MQQKELKKLVTDDEFKTAVVVDKSVHWEVCIWDRDAEFAVIRTARGGKREFKTLDAAKAMLSDVGITSFSVA